MASSPGVQIPSRLSKAVLPSRFQSDFRTPQKEVVIFGLNYLKKK